jgi:uncharacterized protein (DUF2147 family)
MARTFVAASLAGLLAVAPSLAGAESPQGLWVLDDRSTVVEIMQCESQLCGRVVGVAGASRNGAFVPDGRRIAAGQSRRPLCGSVVFDGFRDAGGDRYVGGRLFNPEDGRFYDATATVESADTIRVRGYVGAEMFGRTRYLYRWGTTEGRLKAGDVCRPSLAER